MATIELHLQMTIVLNEGTFLLRKEISEKQYHLCYWGIVVFLNKVMLST